MPDSVNQASIFVPMLVVVLITFVAFLRMGAARAAAMKAGQDADYYRSHTKGSEPEATVIAVRHYGNLFEMPTIFYPACLCAFVLEAVGSWTLVFAWGFTVLRILQSLVHMTYNNPMHRGMPFVFSGMFMMALWINVAIAVFARL